VENKKEKGRANAPFASFSMWGGAYRPDGATQSVVTALYTTDGRPGPYVVDIGTLPEEVVAAAGKDVGVTITQ